MLIREEERQQKRVQSLIKDRMLRLESFQAWQELDPEIVDKVRFSIIRVAWEAYKIGLFSQKSELLAEKEN